VTIPDPPILIITDRRQCSETLEARAESLFRGGCRWLSLREKDIDPRERLVLLARLSDLARAFGATVGLHADYPAALRLDTALHLPSASDVAAARRLLGPLCLIGQSCHDAAQIDRARMAGADYVTLSPVFPSASKPGYAPVEDIMEIATVVRRSGTKILALGGITESTLPFLSGTAFDGVAIMGEAMRTSAPEAWFRRIGGAWQNLTASG